MKRIMIGNQLCMVSDQEHEDLCAMRAKLDSREINGDSPEYAEAIRDYNDALMAIEGRPMNQKRPVVNDFFMYW